MDFSASLQRFKWPLTGVVALVIMAFTWQLSQSAAPAPTTAVPLLALAEPTMLLASEPTATPPPEATPTPGLLAVYVSGAVKKPGVYRLPEGSRADDAVRAAGSFTDSADRVRVNLAAKLRDEQQIYVPAVGETNPPVAPLFGGGGDGGGVGAAPAGDGKVNINTATVAELDPLPRIGPATAQRIIDYRTTNGPFASIEDLQNVKGIGAATFADLQPLITVGP
jgi:competence protein ComEA